MNIFFLDRSPQLSAVYMTDKHVVKMIVETAQILSTAHRVLDGHEQISKTSGRKLKSWHLSDSRESILYKSTHVNHPSSVWARQSRHHYMWLSDHLHALGAEYTHRYHKIHKTMDTVAYDLLHSPENILDIEWVDPPNAMPAEYIFTESVVENYRSYYKFGKSHLHKWTNRDKPYWLD